MRPFIFAVAVLAILSISFAAIGPKTLPVEPVPPVGQCTLSPSSIDAGFNVQTAVVPSCIVDGEEVPCPGLSWSVTIGTISGGPFSVMHNSGSTAGTGTLAASGPGFSCSIPVAVRAPSSGGSGNTGGSGGSSGGSGSTGGASYRTATTVSTTCAGKEGAIKVAYLVKSAPSAIVNVFYTGDGGFKKIFTQAVNSNSTIPFTPLYVGSYELHVSLGADQTTASFSVPECSSGTPQAPQETTVRLQPQKELLFSKTADYANGFSKKFSVYKITDSGTESFLTQISLRYSNNGGEEKSSLAIYDSVPASIISAPSQISFENYPANLGTTNGNPSFSWNVRALAPGQSVEYSYSFKRLITENMVGRFASPSAKASPQSLPLIGSPESGTGGGSGLFASLFTVGGMAIPLVAVLAGIGAIAVGLLAYLFVFGRKKEE